MNWDFSINDWVLCGNIYEVNIRQYTTEGTFAAFARHIPRLKEMGIQILWFMPVTPIGLVGRKGSLGSYYACSSYVTINPEFGDMEDFKSLVNDAHHLGFKVLIDWVANHTGLDHEWTIQHPDFYRRDHKGNFYDAHGWEDVIDLNYDNKELWKAMIAAMRFWVTECDIDGFRCDMAHLVPLDFWKEARNELDKQKKLFWLGETEDPGYQGVFDATYAWELLHSMEKLYRTQISLREFETILRKYETDLPPKALKLLFTSNHDENTHSGSEWERLGNGAKAFAVFCATWKNGIPLIYNGQELPNYKRLKFFEKDEISWTGNNQLHDFYRILLHLRTTNAALKACDEAISTLILQVSEPDLIFSFCRKKADDEVLVILNLSSEPVRFKLLNYNNVHELKEIFLNENFQNAEMHLEAWNFRVYSTR